MYIQEHCKLIFSKKESIFIILAIFSIVMIIPEVDATIKSVQFERYTEAVITYPDGVILGQQFTISFFVKNESANIEKKNIVIALDGQHFKPLGETQFTISRLAASGHFGKTFDFIVPNNATIGKQYINLNFTIGEGQFYNTVLGITISKEPQLVIRTQSPDSIFTDAEFPFEVEIESQGTDLTDVTIQIIPPDEINFRGEKQHTFSSIKKNTPIGLTSRLITIGHGEVDTEHFLPFTIIVNYTDDNGDQKTLSETTSLLLRPRSHFEWGPNAGLWIGDFYLAPTLSIGTFVGPPLGILIGYLFKRRKKKKTKK